MLQRIRLSIEIDVDRDPQYYEGRSEHFLGIPVRATRLGFIHPDGTISDCPPAPENHILHQIVEFETGIREEKSIKTSFALPAGVIYTDDDYRNGVSFPAGTQVWSNNQWIPQK